MPMNRSVHRPRSVAILLFAAGLVILGLVAIAAQLREPDATSIASRTGEPHGSRHTAPPPSLPLPQPAEAPPLAKGSPPLELPPWTPPVPSGVTLPTLTEIPPPASARDREMLARRGAP